MSYHVETTPRFDKEFKKLDKYTQQMIKSWIGKNLQNCENPRAHGKGLTANKSGQWRYNRRLSFTLSYTRSGADYPCIDCRAQKRYLQVK